GTIPEAGAGGTGEAGAPFTHELRVSVSGSPFSPSDASGGALPRSAGASGGSGLGAGGGASSGRGAESAAPDALGGGTVSSSSRFGTGSDCAGAESNVERGANATAVAPMGRAGRDNL